MKFFRRCTILGYIKAKDVLPLEVIEQVQQYISGEVLYIPKKENSKCFWGENTLTKRELAERNAKIYSEFCSGIPMSKLAKKYFLVEKSIQRIIRQEKNRD